MRITALPGWARRQVKQPGRILAGTILTCALLMACSGNDSTPASETPAEVTVGPVGTITATGMIAYLSPEFELVRSNSDGSSPQVIYDEGEVLAFVWSPGGELIAAEVRNAGGTKVVVLSDVGDVQYELTGAGSPVWSPAGDGLGVAAGQGLAIYSLEGEEVLSVESATGLVWSPAGTQVAYLKLNEEGQGVPVIADVETGSESDLAPDIEPADPVYPIAWHPAGSVIAYRDTLYEPETGTATPTEGVPVEWSPDGRILIQTVEDSQTAITDAHMYDYSQGGRLTIRFEIRPSGTGEPPWQFVQHWTDWSSSGQYFVYLDPQAGRVVLRFYDTVAVTQQRWENIQGIEPDISPTTTHVAFHDNGVVWVFALDGSALVDIADGTHPAWQPDATP